MSDFKPKNTVQSPISGGQLVGECVFVHSCPQICPKHEALVSMDRVGPFHPLSRHPTAPRAELPHRQASARLELPDM